MKLTFLGVMLAIAAPLHAQQSPAVSGTANDTLEVVQAASTAEMPSGQWHGKLQLSALPAIAAAQSFNSLNQAIGLHKDLWSLYKGPYEILRVGLFTGFYKPLLTDPSKGPHSLAGGTILVPGSAFDWAMGTNYGDKWLPALKSGILVAYDGTHPKTLGLKPDFVGPILSYQFGSTKN